MSIQRNKLNIGKARRRVQLRSALLLTLSACCVAVAFRLLPAAGMPYGMSWLLECCVTLLAFGGGAYLGLCVLDGDHAKMVPMRRLSRAQMLWLSLLGVLAVCPVLLVWDLLAVPAGGETVQAGAQAMKSSRFLAMLVKSVLIAPVCEEVFFRGYLLHALTRVGKMRASVVVSLCFALVHTSGVQYLAAYALLSMLLCWMTLRTQSLLTPVLIHAAYNAALLVLQSMGLSALFTGWSLLSCAVRLAGCALFAAVLKRAYTAKRAGGEFVLWEGGRLSRREVILLCAAGLLLMVTLMVGG